MGAYGIRALRNQLVVPLRDEHGSLSSLQFIGEDGGKAFLTGGRKRGCYYAIGGRKPFSAYAKVRDRGDDLREHRPCYRRGLRRREHQARGTGHPAQVSGALPGHLCG